MKRTLTGLAAASGAALLISVAGASTASAHAGTYYAVTETRASCGAALDNAAAYYSNTGHGIRNYNDCQQNSQGGWYATFDYFHPGPGDPV